MLSHHPMFKPQSFAPTTPPLASTLSPYTTLFRSTHILLTASDPDGNPLTYSIVAQPVNGTLSGSAPNVRSEAHTAELGSHRELVYRRVGEMNTNVATVAIAVNRAWCYLSQEAEAG